jgi:DNA adenine methylase
MIESMKPLLKWAGGKRHIANILKAHLPNDWDKGTYFEPFLGGAAFFLHLEMAESRLSDVNKWLIAFYSNVKENPVELVDVIQNHVDHFNSADGDDKRKSVFYEFREKYNQQIDSIDTSALLYVLNKLCFNGLYRENSNGYFNVPFGHKKKFPEFSTRDFHDVSAKLSNVSISVEDFESAVLKAQPGDFVYFDPPYVPVDATSSFTSYSSGGFGITDQMRLARTMIELGDRGVKALLSNSSTPLTRDIYSPLKQVQILAPRMVSARAAGRGDIEELLIMNY